MRYLMGTLLTLTLALWVGAATAQDSEPTRILVYGDSLTWGWTPTEPVVPTVRHPYSDRWTTAMQEALGDGYSVVVEGLSGRTTNIDDPNDPKLNGADYLPAALGQPRAARSRDHLPRHQRHQDLS